MPFDKGVLALKRVPLKKPYARLTKGQGPLENVWIGSLLAGLFLRRSESLKVDGFKIEFKVFLRWVLRCFLR